ncbi:bifunctional riboflavin kinase/FMN adenylyltransferase [Salipaludibacillus neizhouensis]|uniref:Riboflavin biosynthesis protein n=1 Tax=Salipaludibacillus neizhouensis TaxID=885475 RepID=A0A3A9KE87_9BACI|nr:bifunctional riboflavin kinase/FAD synthetase [Salipaludibacillus neizhouensis]RKL69040.1 bifunctional riboflavin kinase/FMN adenylyltransferase [Salipaludibacillus neizhouensis]
MQIVKLKHPHTQMEFPETATALGFFDGVHRGHQEVILTAKKKANEMQLKSAVMTFFPHPKEVLRKTDKDDVYYLSTIKEKEKQISELGIDYLFIIEFDTAFSELSPQEFVDQYLIGLNINHVVAGFDYSYGRLGKGSMETLPFHSREKISQTTVDKITYEGEKISSTEIRHALLQGDIDKATTYLGRKYVIYGEVVHGEKRGRTIGFPTANIAYHEKVVIPTTGVYAVWLRVDKNWHRGVCNIGYKPTFHDPSNEIPTIEVHLFDFDGNLYDKEVSCSFVARIRGEKKFASVDDLIAQISKDKETARSLFEQDS